MPEPSTVYVVDDDDAVRTSIVQIIATVGYRVEAFASAQEFLERFDPETECCVVLDVRMREMSGLKLLDELNARKSEVPVIFLTGYGDVPTVVRAMRCGATDFLEKPARPSELLDVIELALKKAGELAHARRERARIQACIERLSPRQREILNHIVNGKTTKEMAFELNISTRTVDSHRSKLLQAMNMKGITQVVRAITRVGFDEGA